MASFDESGSGMSFDASGSDESGSSAKGSSPPVSDEKDSWQPETMKSLVEKQRFMLNEIVLSDDKTKMRNWILKHFEKIAYYAYLECQLRELILTFGTPSQKEKAEGWNWNLDAIVQVIRELFETCQRKMALMDTSYEVPETAEGIANAIEKTRKRMSDVICDLQDTIRRQQDEIVLLREDKAYMDELRAELEAARLHIRYLMEKDRYAVLDPPTKEDFLRELEYRLNMQENLNSSLQDELELEKRSKQEIMNKFLRVEAQRISEHKKQMSEIAEATRHAELMTNMEKEIKEKIQTLTANPTEIEKAVEQWLRTTQEVMEQKKESIMSANKQNKDLGKALADRYHEIDKRNDEIKEAKKELDEASALLDQIKREVEEKKEATKKFEEVKKKLEKKEAETKAMQQKEKEIIAEVKRIDVNMKYLEGLKSQMSRTLPEYSEYMAGLSKEQLKKRSERALLTPVPEQSEVGRSPRSGDYLRRRGRRYRPLTPTQYERLTPEMRERLPPEIREKAEEEIRETSTPEMREVLRSSPYSPEYTVQLDEGSPITETPIPRVIITPPPPTVPKSRISEEAGSSVTTPFPGTPFVSTSRFGFTDPAVPVRELNIPPGPFEIQTPFRHTLLLTSSKREEPLLVNIGVDPKPLTDTENGECFVCDISLDVQPGSQDLLPQQLQIRGSASLYEPYTSPVTIRERTFMSDSPVIKARRGRYDVPPDVTPTSTRRYGLFTPTGIFKKKQFNIRRIPGRDPISELPWSPTYLPEDARSPVSSLSSPPQWSDRSISWEKSHDSDQRSLSSPSPVIKRPAYGYRSPDWDRSSPSPVIKGASYRYQSSESDHSSPSPIIKGPGYRYQSPGSDYISPSPVIKGPSYRYQSSEFDRSSPPPVIKEPSYRYQAPESDDSSPSPVIKGPGHRFAFPESNHSSPSPVIKGPSYRYQSPEYDKSSPSPVIKGPAYRYAFPESDHSSPSPVIKGPAYRYQAPESDESSPSPVIKGPAYRYAFPESDHSSPSPVIKGPSYRYQSPEYDESSPSPVIEGPAYRYQDPESDESSPSPVIKGPDYRYPLSQSEHSSPSPVIKGASYRYQFSESDQSSPSPVIKGPSYRYQSPESDESSPSPVIKGSVYRYRSPGSDLSSPSPIIERKFRRTPSPVSSPLFATPPSGYLSDLDRSRTPTQIRTDNKSLSNQIGRTPGRSASPQYLGYQEDSLNRRWQPDELFSPESTSGSSSSSHTNQSFQRSLTPLNGNYQDPFNRQMQLNDMLNLSRTSPKSSVSPQTPRMSERLSSPDRTHGSSSIESERDYLEGSHDSSLLQEARFLN